MARKSVLPKPLSEILNSGEVGRAVQNGDVAKITVTVKDSKTNSETEAEVYEARTPAGQLVLSGGSMDASLSFFNRAYVSSQTSPIRQALAGPDKAFVSAAKKIASAKNITFEEALERIKANFA